MPQQEPGSVKPSAVTDVDDLQSAVSKASPAARTTTSLSSTGGSNLAAFHLSDDLVNLPILFSYYTPGTSYDKPRMPGMGEDYPTRTINVPGLDAERVSMIDAMQQFASMSGDSLTMLQSALVNRGFIKGKWGNFGDSDETSLKGWQTALERASRSNKTIWEVLTGGKAKSAEDFWAGGQDQYNQAVSKLTASRGGSRRAPLSIELSDPDDIKAYARKSAVETLGFTPEDEFLDRFVGVYQGMQSGYQKKAYAAAESGGKVTRPGQADVESEKYLQQNYKKEAVGFGAVKAFQSILNIMGVQQ